MASRITRSRKSQQLHQPENQSRAKWTPSLTKTLVDLMVEEIHKGNKLSKSFSKQGWKFICDNFRIQTGFGWDNEQLKSRYIALRKQYINMALLLDHCDFEWDQTTSTIIATNEAWVSYIKEHPDADAIRTAGCSLYNQLQIIFAEPEISQKLGGPSRDIDETSGPFHSSPQSLGLSQDDMSVSESDKCTDLGSRKRGRKGMENAMAKGILEMAAATKFVAEGIKKRNEKFCVTDCVKVLDELQDAVSEQVYFAALDLFSNPTAREIFLSLKTEKRLIWLEGKCSKNALC